MKKKIWVYVLCASVIVSASAIFLLHNSRSALNSSFNAIKNNYMNHVEMDDSAFNEDIIKITDRYDTLKNGNEKLEFVLAYNSYINDDIDDALERFTYLNENSKDINNDFIKIYTKSVLCKLLAEQNEYEESLKILDNLIIELTPGEKGKFAEFISEYLPFIMYVPGGREKSIEVLENILEEAEGLDENIMILINSRLSLLYSLNGNYAGTIEKCLEIIEYSQNNSDIVTYEAIAKGDLGVTYSLLGNYEKSGEWFNKCIDVEIEDEEENASIKIYAMSNLYEDMIAYGAYDSIFELDNELKALSSYLPEKEANEILNYSYILLASYFIRHNNIDEAEKMIEKSKEVFDEEEQSFVDTDSLYYLTYGNLLMSKKDYKGAEEIFKTLLEISINNVNYPNTKKSLEHLIEIYHACGEYDKVLIYTDKLEEIYNKKSASINEDYAEYALYKYNKEKLIIDMENQRIKRINIIFAASLISLILTTVIILKFKTMVKINKYDVLTDCYNRRYFDKQYNYLLHSNKKFGLAIIDIDDFKHINDTYGHSTGDMILKEFVDKIKERFNNKVNLFRYGGEEFIILEENSSQEYLFNTSEIIRKTIKEMKWNGDLKVTVSIGGTISQGIEKKVLEKADENLYISKRSGKDRINIS